MADISVEQKKSGTFSRIWAAVAILAVLGLMLWLFTNQQTTTQVVQTRDTVEDPAAVEGPGSAEVVQLSALGANPDGFVGREVRVTNVEVASVLGNRAFWADVPGANPFLVVLAPEAGDASWVANEATSTLQGTVEPVTDTELDAWVQSQAIRPEARDEAGFATHYLRATYGAQ